jgi:hypothetical protein
MGSPCNFCNLQFDERTALPVVHEQAFGVAIVTIAARRSLAIAARSFAASRK